MLDVRDNNGAKAISVASASAISLGRCARGWRAWLQDELRRGGTVVVKSACELEALDGGGERRRREKTAGSLI
jgi:hypothetical protein